MQENRFDKIFREKMKNISVENPPAPEWNSLKEKLKSEGIISRGQGRKRFFIYLSIVIFSTGIASGIFWLAGPGSGSVVENNSPSKSSGKNNGNKNTRDNSAGDKKTETAADSLGAALTSAPDKPKTGKNDKLPGNSIEKPVLNQLSPTDLSVRSVTKAEASAQVGLKKGIYRVQVGAFRQVKPERSEFKNIDNLIIAPQSEDGYTRYYAGEFLSYKEAREQLKSMKQSGYADAFITPVKEEENKNILAAVAGKPESDSPGQEPVLAENSMPVKEPEPGLQPVQNIIQPQIDSEGISPLGDSTTGEIKVSKAEKVKQDSVPPSDTIASEITRNDIPCGGVRSNEWVKRWAIGPYVSWDKNRFYIEPNSLDGEKVLNNLGTYSDSSRFSPQYTAGLNINYYINSKLVIESGAWFSQKQKLYSIAYFFDAKSDSASIYTFNFSGRYFEIPLKLKYNVFEGKFMPYVSAGASFGFNIPKPGRDYFTLEKVNEVKETRIDKITLEMSSIGITGQLSAGLAAILGKNCVVFIEPTYRHHFNPVVKHPTYKEIPVNHFIRTISVGSGILYKF